MDYPIDYGDIFRYREYLADRKERNLKREPNSRHDQG